jgi:hypothetical protein
VTETSATCGYTTCAGSTQPPSSTPAFRCTKVAQRIGDDPATLLRNYVKRKRSKQADQSLAATLGNLSSSFLAPVIFATIGLVISAVIRLMAANAARGSNLGPTSRSVLQEPALTG